MPNPTTVTVTEPPRPSCDLKGLAAGTYVTANLSTRGRCLFMKLVPTPDHQNHFICFGGKPTWGGQVFSHNMLIDPITYELATIDLSNCPF